MSAQRAYLLKEAAVSAVINGAISFGFFIAFFRGLDEIPVWGVGNYVLDFVPQSFAVSLMSALVPGFLARRAMAAGVFGPVRVPAPGVVLFHALRWSLIGLLIGASLAVLMLWASGMESIASVPALAIKIVYGAILGSTITWLSVRRLIETSRAASARSMA